MHSALDACTLIRIQTWNCKAIGPATIENGLGVSWPTVTGIVGGGRADILCIGPTDWLVVASDPEASVLKSRLDTLFEGGAFRATDVSQSLARIQVAGPNARDLLAKGCSLDLHPPLFPPGRAARTRFAGLAVIVRRTSTATFELVVTRSYLEYLMSWFADAELEFETPVS